MSCFASSRSAGTVRSSQRFSARRNGGTLLRVGMDGQVSPLRTETGRWLLTPRPSPDGRSLAFAVTTADAKVWLAER